jgi:uncharacterized protein
MNFEVAKKAIDLYANLLKEGRRFNPWREHYIGFFGGEPLLNFDLIKELYFPSFSLVYNF